MTTPGDLLAQRPHTELSGDDEDYQLGGGELPDDQQQDQDNESLAEQIREQYGEMLEDAKEGDLKLGDFQRYWRRLRESTLNHLFQIWELEGPTLDAAGRCGKAVLSAQNAGSYLTQIYADRTLGVNFTPFTPGPGITERPSANKMRLYSRPIREDSRGAQLKRLGTLATTDLQLSKVRTLYSAFDEDQTVNGTPVKTYSRVTESEKPCALCIIAADQVYFTTDLMPIHDNCECDIELASIEDMDEHKLRRHHLTWVQGLLDTGDQTKAITDLADAGADAEDYRRLVSTEQHGDLGPVLTWASQKFTGPRDLPVPLPVRPLPTISGPRGHEARLARNAARVAQIRAQRDNMHMRYAEGHGGLSTFVSKPKPAKSAVERLAEARLPEFPFTDEAMRAEDNVTTDAAGKVILSDEQRSLARQLATDIWRNSASIEPTVTAAAQSAVATRGGQMSGLDFRLKAGPSLYRKIQAEAIAIANGEPVDEGDIRRAASEIKDSVRYTAVFPEQGYWKSGDELRKALESLGAKTIKDPVGLPLKGYRGRNMAFTFNGVPFEMQVHTELGVATKDEAHQIYNASRKLKAALEAKGVDPEQDLTYVKMLEDMQAKWDTMPMTEGTPVVATDRDVKDRNKVLYVTDHDGYYGPTIPGGEAPLGGAEMLKRERVPSTRYGMDWLPDSPEAKIVAPARAVSDDLWNTLPVQTLPVGTPLKANEGTLKKSSIDKVVSGKEPFREGYIIKLYRTDDGQLHIVDGHTRVAMYNALGKPMPVRIMDSTQLQSFT